MNWINKLERKFERYAIHNLMHYIIILYAVGFVLNLIAPGFYMEYLSLNANAILHGQIWRIVTDSSTKSRLGMKFLSGSIRSAPQSSETIPR